MFWLTMRDRPSECKDSRKSTTHIVDIVIKQSHCNVVKDRTYGYRRIWARLRLAMHDRVTHKRFYLVCVTKACFFAGMARNLLKPRSRKANWPSRTTMFVGVRMAQSFRVAKAKKSECRLPLTAPQGWNSIKLLLPFGFASAVLPMARVAFQFP